MNKQTKKYYFFYLMHKLNCPMSLQKYFSSVKSFFCVPTQLI